MSNTIFVFDSKNAKLGSRVAATYAPIKQTCPSTCELRDKGCYAQTSYTGMFNKRMERSAQKSKASAFAIALKEAKTIEKAALSKPDLKNRGLRIHVSGDSTTKAGTKALAKAALRWIMRGGARPWSYTHAWKKVPRANWGCVSILASANGLAEAKDALAAGYAPAIVTGPHPADGRAYEANGMRIIPCPAQTRDINCDQCKLCWNANRLHSQNSVIAFAAHGARKGKIHLEVVQ